MSAADYLWMFHDGWDLSVATFLVYALLGVVLVVLGIVVYHEKLSIRHLAGVAASIAGIALIASSG